MSDTSTKDWLRSIGGRLNTFVVQAITAVVALVMFAILAHLAYIDRIEAGPILLFAGVILGYLIHATHAVIR